MLQPSLTLNLLLLQLYAALVAVFLVAGAHAAPVSRRHLQQSSAARSPVVSALCDASFNAFAGLPTTFKSWL